MATPAPRRHRRRGDTGVALLTHAKTRGKSSPLEGIRLSLP
jgi:hypothetical protein